MNSTHRLIYCNEKFHVILPNNWIKSVGIENGDSVSFKIDDKDFNKLIIKKSDK